MSLLLPSYSSPSPYSALYFSFDRQNIATELITSRLYYCNSILYNISSKDILKLQCIQNCLARVVTQCPRCSHSVPLLKSLPIQPRIILKLCTIAYHTPSYIFSMLSLIPKSVHLVFTCCLFPGLKLML